MSRIEELPDDFDDSLRLAKPSASSPPPSTPFPMKPTSDAQDGPAPRLPPQMESVRSHTVDEVVQMMNKTPLFMTSADDSHEDNVELEAMRALQYEGTPLENAQGFKEQGNDMAKAKRWKDGQEFYSKALLILQKSRLDREAKNTMSEEENVEAKTEQELEEVCFVNRALCNLELKNYRSTTTDCVSALRYNPKNVKAFFRASLALLALDRMIEATDSCKHGLAVDPTNAALKALSIKIADRKKVLSNIQWEKQEQAKYDRQVKTTLAVALKARNIRTRTTAQPPEMEDAAIHLAPDPVSPTSAVHFPTILLYPLHAQSDFIKAFPETDTIPKHLEYMLPLPWDEKQDYSLSSVDYYMETAKGGLIKVGKNMSLLKALSTADMEVVDGLVKVNVVPKAKAHEWIDEMKARQGK